MEVDAARGDKRKGKDDYDDDERTERAEADQEQVATNRETMEVMGMEVNQEDDEYQWKNWEDEEQQDIDGGLDDAKTKEARKEEMEYAKGMPVYEEAEVAECWAKTGKPPIST